jgi:hypothetical protein
MSSERAPITPDVRRAPPFISDDGRIPDALRPPLPEASPDGPRKRSSAAEETPVTRGGDPASANLGDRGNELFFEERWEDAGKAYADALAAAPDHELASHWRGQIRLCTFNAQAASEVDNTDPRYARPNPENTSFPKPVADALAVAPRRPFVKPTIWEVIGAKLGRLGGAALDGVIAIATGLISERALFGSRERPRHTNWYVQKKALTALRLGQFSLADMISLLKLMKQRDLIEQRNLYDSYKTGARSTLMPPGSQPPATAGIYRQTDGSWTDMKHPTAGAAYTLFGRNVNPAVTRVDAALDERNLLELSEAARVLLHCDRPEGQLEIPFLNTFGAWWIQFENHDWVVAGDPSPTEVHMVPLGAGDPRRKTLGITAIPVPKRVESPHKHLARDGVVPRTNIVTAWWDGSQVYGSGDTDLRLPDGELVACGKLRTTSVDGDPAKGAYLNLPDGYLPLDAHGVEVSGMVNRTYHLGLSFLHTLFTKEHNAIVDMLRSRYRSMGEEELFQTARLVNAAVMARIHTVEWTPAVLPNHVVNRGMNGNWYGLLSNLLRKGKHRSALRDLAGLELKNREFGGIIGSITDNHGVEYSLTQEFMAVYRLHPLMMDKLNFRSIDGTREQVIYLAEMRMKNAARLGRAIGHANVAFSAGTTHAGQLVLNNFAPSLTDLALPGFPAMDMAIVDLLRDLEDGVPRFNDYRRGWGYPAFTRWSDFTDDEATIAKLRSVYQKSGMTEREAIDRVHLLVGTLASAKRPSGFGFGEELFTLFILNASRRLEADPFFTDYYDAAHYTEAGLDWVDDVSFKGVLLRHYPELAGTGLANVENAFEPWDTDPMMLNDKRRHPLMHGGVEGSIER